MAFKPYSPLIEYEHQCDFCPEKFRSYLSPEFFERKGWVKECFDCFMVPW